MLLIILLTATLANCQQCLTTNEGPTNGTNKPCDFPFEYQGQLRATCITDLDPDGRFWCSTKTDHDRKHIPGQGHWGLCRKNCNTAAPFEILELFDFGFSGSNNQTSINTIRVNNVVDVAMKRGSQFQTWLELANKLDLVQMLQEMKQVTIFAPSNDAFTQFDRK